MMLVKYNTAVDVYLPAITAGAQDFKLNPTLASVDAKITIDGTTLTQTTNAPTNAPSGSSQIKISLTAAETAGKLITLQLIDAATKEWEDQEIILQTYGHASASVPADLSKVTMDVNTVSVGGTSQTAGNIIARLPAALSGNGNMMVDIEEIVEDTSKAVALKDALNYDESGNSTIDAVVKSIDTAALNSIDAALSPIDANIIEINGSSVKAGILEGALQDVSGVDVIQADVRTVIGVLDLGAALGNALVLEGEYTGYIKSQVVKIDANAVASIDNALATLANQTTMMNALVTIDTVVDSIKTELDDVQITVNGISADSLTSQEVRDAMKLAPSSGAPASNSIDAVAAIAGAEVCLSTTSGLTGTAWPVGTPQYPVDNLSDAMDMASQRGGVIKVGIFSGDQNLGLTTTGRHIKGSGIMGSSVVLPAGRNIISMTVEKMRVKANATPYTGFMTYTTFRACRLDSSIATNDGTVGPIQGNCVFEDSIFSAGYTFKFLGNNTVRGSLFEKTVIFDMLDIPFASTLIIDNCKGYLTLKNINSASHKVYLINFNGVLTIDASCTRADLIEIYGGDVILTNNGTGAPTRGDTLNTLDTGVDTLLSGVTVEAIEVNAISSIDNALSLTHGTGAWDSIDTRTYWVDKAMGSSGDGLTKATAKKTIAEAIALFANDEPGKIFVVANALGYLETFTVPANVVLEGFGEDSTNGLSANIDGVITLAENAVITKCLIEQQSAEVDAYVIMKTGSQVVKCHFMGGVDNPFIDIRGASHVVIFGNSINGNGNVHSGIVNVYALGTVSASVNILIENNVFYDFPGTAKMINVVKGRGYRINNNTFIGIGTTGYGIYANGANNLDVRDNGFSGTGTLFEDAGAGSVVSQNNEQYATAEDILTLLNGVTVQAIKVDALTSIDHALAVDHAHGTGAWDAVSSVVTVTAIGANALTSIDAALAPRFDAIQSIDTAIAVQTTFLQKIAKNKQEFVKVGSDWYLKVYEADDTTELAMFKVEKYGGGAIGDLTGTVTPSIRGQSLV